MHVCSSNNSSNCNAAAHCVCVCVCRAPCPPSTLARRPPFRPLGARFRACGARKPRAWPWHVHVRTHLPLVQPPNLPTPRSRHAFARPSSRLPLLQGRPCTSPTPRGATTATSLGMRAWSGSTTGVAGGSSRLSLFSRDAHLHSVCKGVLGGAQCAARAPHRAAVVAAAARGLRLHGYRPPPHPPHSPMPSSWPDVWPNFPGCAQPPQKPPSPEPATTPRPAWWWMVVGSWAPGISTPTPLASTTRA